MPKRHSLRTIIRRAGGTNHVARECGVTSGAVSQWLKQGHLPLSEVQGTTDYAKTLIRLARMDADEWDIRLIGRR